MSEGSGIIKCEFVPREVIWSIADDFRCKYWPSDDLPVNIESIIETGLKMQIMPEHYIRDHAKIDAFLRADFTGIIVDIDQYMDPRGRYERRLRFSFAHEIGHYVLHRYIYEQLDFDTVEEYTDFVLYMPDSEHRSFEWQANEFAGRLLVPPDVLHNEVSKVYKTLEEKSLLQMVDKEPDEVLERVAPVLSKPFGVSEDVIVKRVHIEKLWPLITVKE